MWVLYPCTRTQYLSTRDYILAFCILIMKVQEFGNVKWFFFLNVFTNTFQCLCIWMSSCCLTEDDLSCKIDQLSFACLWFHWSSARLWDCVKDIMIMLKANWSTRVVQRIWRIWSPSFLPRPDESNASRGAFTTQTPFILRDGLGKHSGNVCVDCSVTSWKRNKSRC